MKRKIIILFGAGLGLILLMAVGIWCIFTLPLAINRYSLLHQKDYHAISVACLDMMTKPEYKPLTDDHYCGGGDRRLPVVIRDIKAFWLGVSTNEVLIVKTGGFYHMDLLFRKSITTSNSYELVFVEEKNPDQHTLLYTLQSPK